MGPAFSETISHAAPTLCMNVPTSEAAIHPSLYELCPHVQQRRKYIFREAVLADSSAGPEPVEHPTDGGLRPLQLERYRPQRMRLAQL